MKFMKLGTRLDTFYTEEAVRAVTSDVPSDLTIRINNISYLLHKYSLLPKCGLLQRLVAKEDSNNVTLDLHDIPGGEEAFELCAKFCYGITINLSAHNFVFALCAAKFLRMTENVENGNFIKKLESFFSSCILEGWKDSVVTLQNSERVYEWSENLGIVRRCIESIVDKILTPPSKVTWSYTYTRPGYEKKRVPKDWWTEDTSFLGIDMFRCIITSTKASNVIQPQLIGEALHVYACRWLIDVENRPNETSTSKSDHSHDTIKRILETVVSLIPTEKGSVSIKFLMRLLRIAKFVGLSPVTKAELLRLSGMQLDEANLDDLLHLTQSCDDDQNSTSYDVDLVKEVLQSFLRLWKRQGSSLSSMHKVGKMIDLYVQVVAKDANLSVQKVGSLIETLPEIARPQHNDLYKAINIYLKEHPDVSKADKKQLCKVLDCQKLSPEVRAHAVRNERLPLRTIVQILFFEQEKSNSKTDGKNVSLEQLQTHHQTSLETNGEEQSSKVKKGNRLKEPGTGGVHCNLRKFEEPKCQFREVGGPELKKESEIREEGSSRIQLNPHNEAQVRLISEKIYNKGRQR